MPRTARPTRSPPRRSHSPGTSATRSMRPTAVCATIAARHRPPEGTVIDFTLTDENRLVRERPRLRRGRDPAAHPRVGREGEVHREVFAKMGELGFLGAPIPERYGGAGHGLHQLRAAVRGARAGRHRVPRRAERPRRAQQADAAPVGHRGAAPALARPAGEGREAGDVRAHRAGRRDGRRQPRHDGAPRRRRRTSSTARRSGSASPTSPTTSWSSRASTARRSTRASPRSCSSAGCRA